MTGGGVTGGGVLSAELGVPDAFDGALAFDPQTLNLMVATIWATTVPSAKMHR